MIYKPRGVCSKSIQFEIDKNNNITSIQFTGGCPGNSSGISKLVTGMNIDEVIHKLDGVTCGYKSTSCPDQLAQALKLYKNQYEK